MTPHAKPARVFACAAAAFAFGVLAPAVPCAALADTAAATAQPVTVTASNYAFAPAAITVHVGQQVTLALKSGGGVHGIQSADLGIPQTMIMPGTTKTITFTPAKPGTYLLHCSVPCGPGHNDMVLTVKVVQ